MGDKKSFALYSLILGMCWNYSISDRVVLYISLLMLISLGLATNRYYLFKSKIDYVPLLFSLCWLYGVLLGFLRGNNSESIIANFFGMSLYIIYYSFCSLKFNIENILSLIKISSIVNCIFFYISVFLYLSDGRIYGVTTGEDLDGQMAGFRLYWSMGMLIVVGQMCLIFAKYVAGLKIKISEYILFLLMLVSVLGTFSKGFILQFIASCIVILFFSSGIDQLDGKIKFKRLTWLIIVLVLLFTMLYDLGFIDSFLFSIEYEAGSGSRDEQRRFIVNEWTFLGEGLGAVLKSGYSRDELGYGFELNYENLIHKIGVLSILPFSMYIYTIYNLTGLKNNFEIFGLGVGLMSYLISAYGNPFLFSPLAVILHVVVLYLIRISRIPVRDAL